MVYFREFSLFLMLVTVTKLTLAAKTDVKVSEVNSDKKTDNLRQTAAMGIALGMIKVHKKMESNVLNLLKNFTKVVENSKASETVAINQLKELKKTMTRDKYAINILKNGLDLALNSKSVRNYRQALSKMAHGVRVKTPENPLISDVNVKEVQIIVENHLNFMRGEMSSAREALKKVESNKTPKISFTSSKPKLQHPIHMNSIFNHDTVRLPQLIVPMVYEIDVESFYRLRRQNEDDNKNEVDSKSEDKSKDEDKIGSTRESQEDFDENFGPPSEPSGGGGGITGLIASLSGGEGGSDVGALVGAISGVISSLFGPGGLDLPSLLSTGSSLIAGLLGGDENFGKVLADYIGITVEGFSGGGGADNNGIFFGNFLGTLFSQLSADPEEEQGPQPKIFFDNFFKGFEQTKQKRGTNESSSSGKGYFFEFISHIISSIVGGVTNLLLNSSLGSSGGSSQGSADLSSGSSQGSHTGSAQASQGSMHPGYEKPKKPKQ